MPHNVCLTGKEEPTNRDFYWFCIPCGAWKEHTDPLAFAFAYAVCPECGFRIARHDEHYVETVKETKA